MSRFNSQPGKRMKLYQHTGFTPADMPSYVWHDASDASTITLGTGVSQWDDKSGVGLDVIQSIGSRQPTILSNELNNLDVLTFDRTLQQYIGIENTELFSSSDIHLIILAKPGIVTDRAETIVSYNAVSHDFQLDADSNNVFSGELDTSDFSANDVVYNQYNVNTWSMWGAEFIAEVGFSAWFNGVLQNSKSATGSLNLNEVDYRFGTKRGYPGTFLNFQLAEAVMFPCKYRSVVEGYLAWKWGLVSLLPSNHPFKNIQP